MVLERYKTKLGESQNLPRPLPFKEEREGFNRHGKQKRI